MAAQDQGTTSSPLPTLSPHVLSSQHILNAFIFVCNSKIGLTKFDMTREFNNWRFKVEEFDPFN